MLSEVLRNTTIVSIGHAPALIALHRRHLEMEGSGWCVRADTDDGNGIIDERAHGSAAAVPDRSISRSLPCRSVEHQSGNSPVISIRPMAPTNMDRGHLRWCSRITEARRLTSTTSNAASGPTASARRACEARHDCFRFFRGERTTL